MSGALPKNLQRALKDVTPAERASQGDAQLDEMLGRLTGQAPSAPIAPRVEIIQAPVMAKLNEVFDPKHAKAASAGIKRDVRALYKRWKGPVVRFSWSVPLTLILLAFMALGAGSKGLSRFLASTCHWLARKWLLWLSFICVVGFTTLGVELWTVLPAAVWAAPVAAVLAAGALLKTVDMNYPIWNSTLSGLLAPITSCAVAVAWEHLAFFRAYL